MKCIMIFEGMEPGECELCPARLRNAGICSLTMKFNGEECPLRKAVSLDLEVYLGGDRCELLAVE